MHGKLKNPSPPATLELREEFDRAFAHALQPQRLPVEFVSELTEYAWIRFAEHERMDFPGDLADLIAMQYDDGGDPFIAEDWRTLGDLVKDFDTDLSLELLEYLMMRIVSHNGLG